MPETTPRIHPLIQQKRAFNKSLLDWYRVHRRNLPWRETPSLYTTVVSEFMLQQTQVETVLPYFKTWMQTFPNFQSLSQATESQVLKLWEGLGYYSRARNLHRLSQIIVTLRKIPTDVNTWLQFPGVGPYMAAAITSISFKTPAAAVDGNLVRVLSRLIADVTLFKDTSSAAKKLKALASILLDQHHPGDHNQAMMDLGATLCIRHHPRCGECPLKSFCLAYKAGHPEAYPKLARRKTHSVRIKRLWLLHKGALLLEHLPKEARRLAQIHELPLLEKIPLKLTRTQLLAVKRRSISNQRIEESIYSQSATPQLLSHLSSLKEMHWVALGSLDTIILSGPHRRWIEELLALTACGPSESLRSE